MTKPNYYVVLGVASNETEQGVRAAFHDLVKRYHPDRVGPSGAAAFREVMEAYETLGDPRRRSEYDDSLARPLRHAPRDSIRDASLRRDFADVRPSEEALFARFARNFGHYVPRPSQDVKELQVELAISEDEARQGAQVRLGVPVFAECFHCAGHGCPVCHDWGVLESERPVVIRLPPIGASGTTFIVPLTELGIHNFYVRMRVRVEREMAPPYW
jgi:DnaJ-class molecular chaperone